MQSGSLYHARGSLFFHVVVDVHVRLSLWFRVFRQVRPSDLVRLSILVGLSVQARVVA